MSQAGWCFLFAVCALIAICMAHAWIRAAIDHRKRLQLCKARQCEYFTDYLQKGPADLPHSAYHAAIDALDYWENRRGLLQEWGRGGSQYIARMCELYRRQARRT